MVSVFFAADGSFISRFAATDDWKGNIEDLDLYVFHFTSCKAVLPFQLEHALSRTGNASRHYFLTTVRVTRSRFSRDQSISNASAMLSINPLLPKTSSGPVIPRIASNVACGQPNAVFAYTSWRGLPCG